MDVFGMITSALLDNRGLEDVENAEYLNPEEIPEMDETEEIDDIEF